MKSTIALFVVFATLTASAQNLSVMMMQSQKLKGPVESVIGQFCDTVRKANLESQQCSYNRPSSKYTLEFIRDEAVFASSEKSFSEDLRNDFKVIAIKSAAVLEQLK